MSSENYFQTEYRLTGNIYLLHSINEIRVILAICGKLINCTLDTSAMVAQVKIEDNLLGLNGSEVSTIVDNIDGEDPFPKDAFSAEQRRSGALILHIIGILYVTRGMTLVTINFFVPSLEVIMKKVSSVAMVKIVTLS